MTNILITHLDIYKFLGVRLDTLCRRLNPNSALEAHITHYTRWAPRRKVGNKFISFSWFGKFWYVIFCIFYNLKDVQNRGEIVFIMEIEYSKKKTREFTTKFEGAKLELKNKVQWIEFQVLYPFLCFRWCLFTSLCVSFVLNEWWNILIQDMSILINSCVFLLNMHYYCIVEIFAHQLDN